MNLFWWFLNEFDFFPLFDRNIRKLNFCFMSFVSLCIQPENMNDGMVAKLALQSSDLYADAMKLLQLPSIRELWPKVRTPSIYVYCEMAWNNVINLIIECSYALLVTVRFAWCHPAGPFQGSPIYSWVDWSKLKWNVLFEHTKLVQSGDWTHNLAVVGATS